MMFAASAGSTMAMRCPWQINRPKRNPPPTLHKPSRSAGFGGLLPELHPAVEPSEMRGLAGRCATAAMATSFSCVLFLVAKGGQEALVY